MSSPYSLFHLIVLFEFGNVNSDTNVPGYDVPLAIIGAVATAAGLLVLFTVTLLLRARRKPRVSGHEAMLGSAAEVVEDFDAEGWVRIHGETWRARAPRPVRAGERLRVASVQGLLLILE
jgi:membrane-bound serine protease (ClpP class)